MLELPDPIRAWLVARIEAVWPEGNTLYGYYHNEPGGLAPGTTLTAPRIGAAIYTQR